MKHKDKNIIIDENQTEEILNNNLNELQDEINELEEISDEQNKNTFSSENEEILKLKELLARTQADYQNFKFRNERDREDIIFYIKNDIFKKILPRVDDLERIIKNTPDETKTGALFEGILALEKALKRDLENLGVKPFESIGDKINPSKHEVISQIPSTTPGIIVDEFEKGYILGDRVLRVAKVIVGT